MKSLRRGKKRTFAGFIYHEQGRKELNALKKEVIRFYITAHAQLQIKRRGLMALNVKKTFQKAVLVERQENQGKPVWLVMIRLKNKPVHLVIAKTGAKKITVITAYDPSTEPERWSRNYRHRAC